MSDEYLDDERFFQQQAPEDYLQAWSKYIAQEKQDVQREDMGAMLLKMGHEYVAWSAGSCLSVLAPRPIHAIPHRSHPVLKGIAAMTGQLIPCLSLARLLDMQETSPSNEQSLLLIGEQHRPIGMLVDHIQTYIRYHHHAIAPLPSNLAQAGQCFSQGMLDWKDVSVPLLDEALVMAGFERCMR